MTPKRVRVRDVAERAGVSTGTVSNVLNQPQAVSESTRRHVQQVMDELNFVRDATARQLRVGRSQTVGVRRVFGHLKGNLNMALSAQIVNLVRLDFLNNPGQIGSVR